MKKQIPHLQLFNTVIIILSFCISCSHDNTSNVMKINPRGGKIFRIPALDIPKGNIAWEGRANFKYEKGADSVGYIVMKAGASSNNTLRLLPNRSYVISVLLQADFPRPTEVNMGLRTMDGGGKYMMWHLNGIPNKTNGWQRWEWEFNTDQRVTHGHFAAQFYRFPDSCTLKIADIAFIELPEKPIKPYMKGEGVTFRGGPGNIPMRVENVQKSDNKVEVRVTGALYTFYTKGDSICARQLLEKERDISVWRSSLSLAGLEILHQNNKECVLANDKVTIGIQCDGFVFIAPQDELIMTCTSKIGGKWNRLACGHMIIIDEWGGFAVNPDIPLGSGRLARVDAGLSDQPGRVPPGGLDFADIIDNQTFLSHANPGWRVRWYVSPGERLAISVFPPKPYPWKESFTTHWSLTNRRTKPEDYVKMHDNAEIALLWSFIQRSWAFSYGHEHVPYDANEMKTHVAAIKAAGMRPIVYMSPYYYYSRDAAEVAEEAKRLKDTFGIEGVYYDGIPSQEWIVAYEEMRMTREVFPDGIIILHNTGHPYNGIPPLGDPSIKIPAIETYANVNYGGELIYGEGRDWVYPKYMVSQYRVANTPGALVINQKVSPWAGLTELQQDLMMLSYNGRSANKTRYKPYIEELEKLWEKKGNDPDFYEKYYLPKVKELTRGLLPK
jgi:hypothetical protein